MKTCLSLLTAVSIILTAPALSAEECFDSSEQFGGWLVSYYKSPQPEKLHCSLEFLATTKIQKLQDRRWSTLKFYAALLRTDPKLREELFETLGKEGSNEARFLAVKIFFIMDSDDGRKLLKEASKTWKQAGIPELAATLLKTDMPPYPLDGEIATARDAVAAADELDGLWLTFFATGDPAALKRIASALPWSALPKSPQQVVGQTARWSLRSNATQHPRVREVLTTLLETSEGPTKEILGDILSDLAEQEREHKDGKIGWDKVDRGFAATLVLTDKPKRFFDAWSKPGESVPVSVATTATRGRPVVMAIMFKGCAPNDRGWCDVLVDFAFLKPDGSAYGVQKDLELWVGKPPPPKGKIELGATHLGLVFEPEDPSGTYKIMALLHDKVSGVKLKLEKPLELKD